jgi:hypothetical protein
VCLVRRTSRAITIGNLGGAADLRVCYETTPPIAKPDLEHFFGYATGRLAKRSCRFAGSWRCSPGDEEVSAARRSCLDVGLTARNRARRLEGATLAASLPCTGTKPFGVAFHRAAPGFDLAFGSGRSSDPETGNGLRATKGTGGRSSTSSLPARDESSRRRSADGTPGALVGWNMPTRALEGASP